MSRQPAIGFVLACIFLDALGIGLIIPVLPALIGTLADSPAAQTTWYGAIMLSYGLMQFMFSPMLGALSDRVGRRPVLLCGILGLGLMMVVPAFTESLWWLLASRMLGGMMSSNIAVAQAYIADVTSAEKRLSSFGKIGAIFGIAFVLGPALGGVLGQYDIRLPFMVASAVCLLNFAYGLFGLPESLPNASLKQFRLVFTNPFRAIARLAKQAHLQPILLISVLYTLGQGLMQTTWALYTQHRYGWTPLYIGLSIFGLGLCISLIQGVALPRLCKHFEARALMIMGLGVGTCAMGMIALSPWGWLSMAMNCVLAAMGIVGPAVQGVISRHSAADMQGMNLGAMSSLGSFTGAISPLIGTPLMVITTAHADQPALVGAPYFLSATLLAIALYLAWRLPAKV